MHDDGTYYLAGPMTGIPQFNYPEFFRIAKALRAEGFDIISPAEQDSPAKLELILESPDGDLSKMPPSVGTWGDFLSHDVKLIADGVNGIFFMPGWQKSRGARLEAFVGITCAKELAEIDWYGDKLLIQQASPEYIKQEIFNAITV